MMCVVLLPFGGNSKLREGNQRIAVNQLPTTNLDRRQFTDVDQGANVALGKAERVSSGLEIK
jgi:hypothetical protein